MNNYKKLVKEALEVLDKDPWYKRPVSSTIGRIMDPLTALIVGSGRSLWGTEEGLDAGMDISDIADVVNKYKKKKELEDTAISLGSSAPLTKLKRIWGSKRNSLLAKLFGTIFLPVNEVTSALTRADHYDPLADLAVIYHNEPAIVEHELGHAIDFKQTDNPLLYSLATNNPIGSLYTEMEATNRALRNKILKSMEKKKKGKLTKEDIDSIRRQARKLTGAYGTYVGNTFIPGVNLGPLNPVALASGLVGQAVGSIYPYALMPSDVEEDWETLKEQYDKLKK